MQGWKGFQVTGTVRYACLTAGFLALLAGASGCQEHRISLQEFLSLDQQIREATASQPTSQPSSQPAEMTAEARELVDRTLWAYRLGPGDVINVILTPTEESNGLRATVRVTREGQVELPLAGLVKVGGLELEDVETAIRKAYVPKVYVEIAVHVEVLTSEVTRVLVTGAVREGGLISLRRTERNPLFAIVAAGGVSEASSGRIHLKRLNRPVEEVTLNLLDPVELKAALALDPLENGDIVNVEAATPNYIFVGGLVMAPRPQPYPPGAKVTMLQALAAAGGLRTDLTPKEGTLIRRMPDGRDVQVKLDWDRITTGKDPNITLLAGDVLWVPHTLTTRAEDWVNRNVFLRVGYTATGSYTGSALDYWNSNAADSAFNYNNANNYDPFSSLIQNSLLQSIQSRQTP